ncbi:hypothetical protein TARUN_6058 [Trichoderma arundinaceum]|uniref:Uncharacterized protein n=1 Tax=Trichoderma arundinaceum TaxID=490622 RepID=A0A395NJU9_TRIAR|nr:hypothetical protein TARUN_6058 [Trichoderma arundinaceum]
MPKGVYVDTSFAAFDGTTTSTESVKPSTSLSLSTTSSPNAVPPPPPPPPSSSSVLPSIFETSSIPPFSSFMTQAIITTSHPESHPTITKASISAATSSVKPVETNTPLSPTQSTSINTVQIAGIAIGSSAVFGLIASIFFFFGRRNACPVHSNRRISIHNVRTSLGSAFKKRLGKLWERRPKQQPHRSHGATMPAELTATGAPQRKTSPPERPVNNSPYFYHPVTICVAGELESGNMASHNPSRRQNQQDEILPVELPTSLDPGNSPLPKYDELDTAGRYRVFSWAAPESAYRPDKFEPGNKI